MNNALRFSQAIVSYFFKTFVRVRRLKDREDRRKFLVEQVHTDSKSLLDDLGFEVKVVGMKENVRPGTNYLVVGNHLSYMDPFVLVSVLPSLFVTSVDMRETPVLGQICEMAGCIFVERRNRTTIEKDIVEMTESLQSGMNVTIYPEGGTTNGLDVGPFKKSLLMSAVFAGVDILPVAIKYTSLDGVPWSPEISDQVAWYGDMGFGPHFLNMMKKKQVKVELHFLPPIKVTKESTRNELAHQAREAIRTEYLRR